MHNAVPELTVQRYGASGIYGQQEDMLAAYAEVYAGQLDDPFFSTPSYWQRLEAYAGRTGFTLVTGRLENNFVGHTFGYTLPAGSHWWQGFRGEVDPTLLAETGERTFAVT
ncbi:MAG: GNAT family N-acetyltransferase, partial [Actinobacteria bacterium]|nr:GNAT family N-acetyltransferase [Actinomycetota bacterium]